MIMAMQSVNSGNPSVRVQLSQYQAQLQQARQEAARASDRVIQLEQQTEVARVDATRAHEHVRDVQDNSPFSPNSGKPDRPARRPVNSLDMLSGTLLDVTA